MTTASTKTESSRKIGRASRSLGQLWQVPIFVVGLIAAAVTAASTPFQQDRATYGFERDLEALRKGIADQPDDSLLALANKVIEQSTEHPDYAGESQFLVGALYQRLAEKTDNREKAGELFEQAGKYLSHASKLSVREEDRGDLHFELGKNAFRTGNLHQAIDYLKHAVEEMHEPVVGYEVLVAAYLKLPTPNLDAALAANQKQFDLFAVNAEDDVLARSRLTRGEILFRKGMYTEALKTLGRIGRRASVELRVRSQYLQTQCCEKAGLWLRAVNLWEKILPHADKVPGGSRRVYYSLGLAHRKLEPPDDDAAAKAWYAALRLGGDEAQASALKLGHLYLARDPNNAKKSLSLWSTALEFVADSSRYKNGLVTLDETRSILRQGFQLLSTRGQFVEAGRLAELYKRVAAKGQADILLAQAAEAQAKDLVAAAEANPLEAKTKTEQANKLFLKAGHAFKRASVTDPEDPSLLWRSSKNFIAAKDYGNIIDVLRKFVTISTDEMQLAEAYLSLATTYRTLDKMAEAREAFYTCIEFPTSFAYRARLQLAEDAVAEENFEHAINILTDNLRHRQESSTPFDRKTHEKSLYMLANLLFDQDKYAKASIRLKEAARQYSDNPGAIQARERLGTCYRRLAKVEGDKIKADLKRNRLSKENEAIWERQRRGYLNDALDTYQSLSDDLTAKSRRSATETDALRRALFFTADIYFDLGNFAEALRRYQELQDRYRGRLGSLVACYRIYRCLSVMVSTEKQRRVAREAMRKSFELASADLKTMPASDEAFRDKPGRWSKQRWESWMKSLEQQITPASDTP